VMQRWSRAMLVILALAAGGIAFWDARSDRGPADPDADRAAVPAPAARDPAALDSDATRAPTRGHGRRPRSLRGTRADGELTVGDHGRFVVTPATRRFFDYWLAATGEATAERLRARIVAAIERRLPPEPAGEAIALLDRYLRYRERARDLAGTAGADDLAARVAAVTALRREVFGPQDATALFADEEAAVEVALLQREVATEPDLDPEERALRLAALEAALPPEERAARAEALRAVTLRREEAALRARGGSPDDLRALRERLVGPEAAARLTDLDRRRADWDARLQAYRTARADVEADPTRDPPARAAAVERLLAERFTPAERRRVQALEAAPPAPSP
jgi:lipase chaperone LimK